MTDRELLEMAAKAADYEVRWHESWQCFVHVGPFNATTPPTMAGQREVWIPLDDDGDALRLAASCLSCTSCIGMANAERAIEKSLNRSTK